MTEWSCSPQGRRRGSSEGDSGTQALGSRKQVTMLPLNNVPPFVVQRSKKDF